METRTEVIPVQLGNGSIVDVEATVREGVDVEGLAAEEILSFDGVTEAIEGIASAINGAMVKVAPRKATAEFGLEVAVEAGKLTALIVKGSGTASLTITLEWGE